MIKTIVRRAAFALLVGLTLLAVALWALRTFFLPDLSVLQPRLEAELAAALKQPVQVHGFRARWGLTQIDVHLDGLTVGPVQAPTLRLEGVDASIQALPLLVQQLHLDSASVAQAALTATRSAAGDWQIAGLGLAGQNPEQSRAALRAVLGARSIRINQLDVTVKDELKRIAPTGQTTMRWTGAYLVQQTSGKKDYAFFARSALGVPEWGGAVQLDGGFNRSLLGDAADPSRWRDGLLTLRFEQLKVEHVERGLEVALQHASSGVPSSKTQGMAAQWLGHTLNPTVELRFDAGKLDASLSTVLGEGSLFYQPSNTPGIAVLWENLAAPRSQMALHLSGRYDVGSAIGRTVWPAEQGGLGGAAAQLKAANLKGLVQNAHFKLAVERTSPAVFQPTRLAVDAQVGEASIDALPLGAGRQPVSFGNVSGQVSAEFDVLKKSLVQASADFNAQDAWLDAPQWLGERLKLKDLRGKIAADWTAQPAHKTALAAANGGSAPLITFKNLTLSNADLSLSLDGEVHGRLARLNAKVPRLELASVPRYLPASSPQGLRDGLQRLLAGQALDGRLALRGDVSQLAFAAAPVAKAGSNESAKNNDKNADFLEFTARIQGAAIAVGGSANAAAAPLRQLQGKLTVRGAQAELEGASASLQGVAINASTVRIADVRQPVLELNAKAAGPAPAFAAALQASPLGAQWAAQGFAPSAQGAASVEGRWLIPFAQPEQTQFNATATLNAAQLLPAPGMPNFSDVALAAQLTERGITLKTARAKLFGSDVQAQGSWPWVASHEAGTLKVQGSADLAQVSKHFGAASGVGATAQARWWGALAAGASGVVGYTASAGLSPQGWQVSGVVDAAQVAVSVPKVYQKSAGSPLPIAFQSFQLQQQGASVWQSQIKAGQQFNAVADHGWDAKTQAPRLLRAAVALGEQAVVNMPDAGVNAHVVLDQLNADALGAYLSGLPWGAAANVAGFELPISAALQVQALTLANRSFTQVIAGVTRGAQGASDALWRANVYADGINGYLTWADASTRAAGSGTLTAKLQSLTVPDSEVKNAKNLLDIAPNQLPNVDVEVAQLTVAGKSLGALSLRARNLGVLNVEAAKRAASTSSGWAIDALQLKSADSELNAKGLWRKQGDAAQVSLTIDASSQDLGTTLARLGQANVVKGAAGKLAGELAWRGTPFALDAPSLTGTLTASLGKGQFLKVEPGAGRMLALFSLQSIPRRLTLDFRDMFSDGFAFDTLTATASLSAGVLKTDDFLMQSAAAEVRGQGSLDISKETQALRFTVKPDFNAGGVSLAYMLVNPPLGLGTLLVQWLLREPLRTQLTVEYDVTGPWSKPVVTQMDRNVKLKPDASKLPTSGGE